MYLTGKFFSGVICALIFAVILTIHLNFKYFIPVFMVSLPIILIAGFTCTYITDYYVLERLKVDQPFQKYLISLVVFGLGGVLTISMITLIQGSFWPINVNAYIVLGLLPAILYFHVNLFIQFLLSRLIA